MKFRLVESVTVHEDVLVEATVPMYREMFFELIAELSTNDEFKEFIRSENRGNIQFHHIDGEYEGILRKRAKHNYGGNIAVLSKTAHEEITRRNKSTDTKQKIENIYQLKKDYPHEVFLLSDCVPGVVFRAIESSLAAV